MPITVLAQSTSVNVTINGSGEEYSCTLNDQTVNITSGQTFQQTGLAPSTNYTINCHSVNDSCLGARATFTTGKWLLHTMHSEEFNWLATCKPFLAIVKLNIPITFCRTKARSSQWSNEWTSVSQWGWWQYPTEHFMATTCVRRRHDVPHQIWHGRLQHGKCHQQHYPKHLYTAYTVGTWRTPGHGGLQYLGSCCDQIQRTRKLQNAENRL